VLHNLLSQEGAATHSVASTMLSNVWSETGQRLNFKSPRCRLLRSWTRPCGAETCTLLALATKFSPFSARNFSESVVRH
jgi:hypothetical protein